MGRPILEYGVVAERHERALIVASGPSAGAINWHGVRLPSDLAVITVKSSVRYVPQATHWMTVDGNDKSRGLIRERRPGVRYYAAMPKHYQGPKDGVTFLKRLAGNYDRGGLFGLAREPDSIHAGNSGYAALGLAYHMYVKKLVIIGIDGIGGYWFDENRPRSLKHLPKLFQSAVPQLKERGIEVINASPDSILDCFPKVTADEALDWITKD